MSNLLLLEAADSQILLENGYRLLEESVDTIDITASAASGYQTVTPYSFTVDIAGTNRIILVCVSMLSVGGSSVTGITVGGVAMTLVRARASVSGAIRAEIWKLLAPATGTAVTVTVTLSAALDSTAAAVVLNHASSALDVEASADASATNVGAADATVDVTTITDNGAVVDCVASDDASISVGAGQTRRTNTTGALGSGASSIEGPKTPAGTVTMSWTNVAALATWTIVSAAVGLASVGGGPFPPWPQPLYILY